MTDGDKKFVATPSQTVGPFFHLGLTRGEPCSRLAAPNACGEHIRLVIRLLDGEGVGVPDALVEIWQADANGKYDHPNDEQHKIPDPAFLGFGRLPTDTNGVVTFETVRPGRVPGIRGAPQAPHINVHIFSRGILRHVSTRIYFADDPANVDDAILRLVLAGRRQSLMAGRDVCDARSWRIDLRLCGVGETVFFDA